MNAEASTPSIGRSLGTKFDAPAIPATVGSQSTAASISCVTSGYAAVFVLALYISSATVSTPYSRHQLLWLACPLLLYWVGYLWPIAHRGKMHHDPLVFALRDRTSRVLVLLMLVTVLSAI